MRNKHKLEEMLIKHEGLRLKAYRDTKGKLTIGIGRNLDDVGISEAEARMLLLHDIETARIPLFRFKWFTELDDVRKDIIISMVFNLGLTRFLRFKNLIAALKTQDYEEAAVEMLDSVWAKQVGLRAVELSKMMFEGKYQD